MYPIKLEWKQKNSLYQLEKDKSSGIQILQVVFVMANYSNLFQKTINNNNYKNHW